MTMTLPEAVRQMAAAMPPAIARLQCPRCKHPVSRHWKIGARLCSVGQGGNRDGGGHTGRDSGLPPCYCPGLP